MATPNTPDAAAAPATGNGAAAPSRVKSRGLEGVVALDTALCYIDGQAGELIYAGYEIDDLARNASFEEVAHLLWHGELPTRAQLEELSGQLRAERDVHPDLLDHL